MVLLHGLLASAKYWRPVRKRLTAAGYRVVAIDLLGFGYAARLPARRYGYDEHVSHIKQAIETVAGGEPVFLVGHSLGGLVAMHLARLHPEMISQLIVLNSPLYRDGAQARGTILGTGPLYRFLLTSRLRSAGWITLRSLAFRVWGRHSARAREGSIQNVVFRGMGLEDLHHLEVETIVVTGLRDRAEYLDNLQATKLPDNVDVLVTPTGHHLPARAPDFVSWLIDQRLSESQRTDGLKVV